MTLWEVQRRIDASKSYSWPAYVSSLRVRERCPVQLFVLALTASVERWAARSISLGGGNHFRPFVIGPGSIPKLVAGTVGSRELRLLSALVHARSEEAVEIAAHALGAPGPDADPHEEALYFDLIMSKLNPAARATLEESLMEKHYEPLSALCRQWKEAGLEQGLERGLERGREEGREEGRAAGLARSVMLILEARGIPVSRSAQKRLHTIRDVARLDALVRRAAVVNSTRALFAAR